MQTFAGNSVGDHSTTFLAGQRVPAGTYHLLGTQREVHLEQEDILPATFDGRVGVYERLTLIGEDRRDQE